MRLYLPRFLASFLFVMFAGTVVAASAEEPAESPQPVTTIDPNIPADELALLLKPFTKTELLIEADGWQDIVKAKAEEIAKAEIAVKRQNQEITKAVEAQAQAEDAKKHLDDVEAKAADARESGDAEAIKEAGEAADKAQSKMQEVSGTLEQAAEAAEKTAEMQAEGMSAATRQRLNATAVAADRAQDAVERAQDAIEGAEGRTSEEIKGVAAEVEDATQDAQVATREVLERADETVIAANVASKVEMLDATAEAMAQAEEAKQDEKVDLLEEVNRLREERTKLIDNLRAAVDELQSKTDKEDSDTLALIKDYRLYISGVSGISVDVTDAMSAWAAITGWIASEEGGIRWAKNILTFFGILVTAWFLSIFLSGIMNRAMRKIRLPLLLQHFLVKTVRWVVMIIGIIMALAALELSVGPLLALVGAAGFIVAFALQDSLSNFASGLMILFFRPFDVGDIVDAGGVSGKVTSMNLVSTTIKTFDNKQMIVPNNSIIGNVITNATTVSERRVDMEFGIGYDDDIDQAQDILEDIVQSHPKVLKDPVPTIKMNTLADSSVNFICRPWVKTDDYWGVYWDVTRQVKKRFDAAGIGIPFPQQDVHLYVKEAPGAANVARLASQESVAQSEREPAPRDGGLDQD